MDTLSSSTVMALLERSREGDEQALGRLLESYRAYLSLIARLKMDRRLHGKVSESDIVQDVFKHARCGFTHFRGRTEPEITAWLRKILVAQVVTQVRRYTAQRRDVRLEQRLEKAADQSSQALERCLMDPGTSPSGHAARREAAVLVADALASLPSEQREVLVMRHLEAHSFPEVARSMGRPLENVKSLWRRGIKSLRDMLAETTSTKEF